MRVVLFLLFIFISCEKPVTITEAKWVKQSYGEDASVRAIHAYSSEICWLAGSKGIFSYTMDGGTIWITDSIPGATHLEFRDIHVFNKNEVIVLSIGPGDKSRMFKTVDMGKTWETVFINDNEKAFFDAIEFWDHKRGFTMSDAVDGKILIYTTKDAGNTWQQVPAENIPPALEGEGSFAASGTNIMAFGKNSAAIGGSASPSRIYLSEDYGQTWDVVETPIQSESPYAGTFSIAFYDDMNGIAVGGKFDEPNNTDRCVMMTNDGGKTWRLPKNPNALPYRSCVRFLPNTKIAFATGRSGSNYSLDFGETWIEFDTTTYYTMSFAPNSSIAWAAGPKGNLAKLEIK